MRNRAFQIGTYSSVHSEVFFENTVAASALYSELVSAEVCATLGLATEPRTVSAGRRPVMELAGIPHELIAWTARRGEQIEACREDLEREYVTAVDDNGEPKFLPVVSERARTKLNQMAGRKTCPPKRKTQPLAQLRVWWKTNAILNSGVKASIIDSLLEHARAAAMAIRARIAQVVDVALAALDVTAIVFVMTRRMVPPPAPARRKPAVTSPSSSAAAAAIPAWTTRSWTQLSPRTAWTSANPRPCAASCRTSASTPPAGP
ncbi:relaxase domain-containing protein [Streptomyces sp. NPDC090741]|uniref:relaxase domain-containing protein n=1 Tax=Streptomyces sp. NPDC090741 TaxID=3365967 RepID=UPI003807AEB9